MHQTYIKLSIILVFVILYIHCNEARKSALRNFEGKDACLKCLERIVMPTKIVKMPHREYILQLCRNDLKQCPKKVRYVCKDENYDKYPNFGKDMPKCHNHADKYDIEIEQ